jgi:AsmA protein
MIDCTVQKEFMKTVKILGGIVGGAVLFVIAALLAVWLVVKPNDYKGRIAAAVKESSGRDLNLQGDIKLSLFPWVALELGPASLSNPPGFGNEPFLTFNRAAVRVRLLPLLHEELQVARVELDGLDLRLSKNAAGKGNWESAATVATPQAPAAPEGAGSHFKLASIAGVTVTHGRVSFNQYTLKNIDLETGTISEKRDIPVNMRFDADRGIQGESVNLTAKFDLEADPATDDMRLEAFSVSGTWARAGDERPMHYEVSVPSLEANLKKQTLAVPDFSLTLSNVHLTGKLAGAQITDDPHLSGSLALQSLVLGEFAPRFGIPLPKTRDPKALSSLSAQMNFNYDGKGATLSDLQFKLDDTTLKGKIELALEPKPAVTFALAADRIDLDRYRPPAGAKPDPKSAAADTPAPRADDKSAPLSAAGTFSLAAAHAGGLDFTNLNVTLGMKDHVTHLHPLEAQLYGGTYSGDLTYDARTLSPSLSLDEHLSGVDMAQLAAATRAKGRVSGKANVDIKGTARGADADDILKTLSGHFAANVASGAIEGVDVGYELALAQSLIGKETGPAVRDTGRTPFETFKVSATINNGVAETHDLSIISPVLKVAGEGTINLPTSGLDLNVTASIMKSATTTALDIPLKISGTYSDPKVKPDMEGLAKGAIKDKLKDVLKKNGLEGLFGH